MHSIPEHTVAYVKSLDFCGIFASLKNYVVERKSRYGSRSFPRPAFEVVQGGTVA
jgi:hypothetical protein